MPYSTVPLIKPGAPHQARRALRRRQNKRDSPRTGVVLVPVFTTVMWVPVIAGGLIDLDNIGFLISVSFSGLNLLLYGTWGVWSWRARRDHNRHVANGNIVYVDHRLIDVWDELRGEHEVTLTDEERAEETSKLIDAAADLRAELDAWNSAEQVDEQLANDSHQADEPNERCVLAQARVRARLLHEVRDLKDRKEAEHRLAVLAAEDLATLDSVHPAGVTDDEVNAQLALVRERAAQSAPQPDHQVHANSRETS